MINFIRIIIAVFIIFASFYLHNWKKSENVDSTRTQIVRENHSDNSPLKKQQIPQKQTQKPLRELEPISDKNTQPKKFKNNREIIDSKVGENYLDNVLSGGSIIRWNPSTFPLKVYVENNQSVPPYYIEQIKKAFVRWQRASDDFIRFTLVSDKDYADIRCIFPDNFERKCGVSNIAAWHTYWFDNSGGIKYSNIEFAKVSCQKKLYAPEEIYVTALHEIGHSLGLSGHSSNRNDLMYPSNYAGKDISQNDLRTLKLVYSIIPDKTNKPFSEQEKEGLVTSDDIWGSKENKVDTQLEVLQKNVSQNGSAAYSEYMKIGSLYYDKKDYEKAIFNYKKSLEVATQNSVRARIYLRIADAYTKLNNYEEALNYAEQSNELVPDDNTLTFIAQIHYDSGNYGEAKSITRSILNRNPKVHNAYKILGNIYIKEKDYESVQALYERGLRQFPDNPPLIKKAE